MFNHFKPTPRKPQGSISRKVTASENYRVCVRYGYVLARQLPPEPKPVEEPEPFCDEETHVAVAAAECAAKLPALKTTPVLKESGRAKSVSKSNRAATLQPSSQPGNPVNKAGIIKATAKRTVHAAANPDRINYRYVALPDVQDSS